MLLHGFPAGPGEPVTYPAPRPDRPPTAGWRAAPARAAHDLRAVAFHEAGHAVMFLLLGVPVAHAVARSTDGALQPDWRRIGERVTTVTPAASPDDFECACRAASAMHAGLAAELILAGLPWHAPLLRVGTDLEMAERILEPVTGRPYCPRAHGLAQLHALRDLSEHWREVEAVARRLMAKPGERIAFN